MHSRGGTPWGRGGKNMPPPVLPEPPDGDPRHLNRVHARRNALLPRRWPANTGADHHRGQIF